MHWRVFKSPVPLFVGGIAATLLELAEPRIRTGVWEHSIYPVDPIRRMRRTGMAAQVTVYAAADRARELIGAVNRKHGKVKGETPAGVPYRAMDPELLAWVGVTALYGFIEAYAEYGRTITDGERNRFYGEGVASASLYGLSAGPASIGDVNEMFDAMVPVLEPHRIVLEFLDITATAPILPRPLRPLQRSMIRAAVELLPEWVVERLDLGSQWRASERELRRLRILGRALDRIPIPGIPALQACRRLGLPWTYLY
jgi:uncharacterized protein (DUF2236 family)